MLNKLKILTENHLDLHHSNSYCLANRKITIDKLETGLYNNGQFSVYCIQEIKD
jgi:hypothetical protein